MGIPVKLEVFEGPLDLLLHLIEKLTKAHQKKLMDYLKDNFTFPNLGQPCPSSQRLASSALLSFW